MRAVCLAAFVLVGGIRAPVLAAEEPSARAQREAEPSRGASSRGGGVPAALKDEPSDSESRFLYGGEVVFNLAPKDPGYFNQTDYGRDSLRLFRLNVALELRASDRVALLTEIRSDNLDPPRPYALYVRFRPWSERAFDLQLGRVPPVFGAFLRRRYEYDNPLIGYPLPYQYPAVIRPDSAPSALQQVFFYRGYGAFVRYPIGDTSPESGLALVNPLRWDTGVQVRIGNDPLSLAVAVTQGTIANPRVDDDNEGKQIAARLGFRPSFGADVGFSVAKGDYVSDEVKVHLPGGVQGVGSSSQTAIGVDGEIARGSWLLRAEAIWSEWDMPTLETGPLGAFGFTAEGRYKIMAGLFAAGRISGTRFESVPSESGPVTWDSPVTRFEAGFGYAFHRRLLGKIAIQYNERDATRVPVQWIPAMQLLFWF